MLAFVDSDDTLPADAYSHMVSTLERTGSDFVVGKLVRDRDGVKSAMPLMRRNHERQRLAITPEEMPETPGGRLRRQQGLPAVLLGRRRTLLP